jgi:hypothetical protein
LAKGFLYAGENSKVNGGLSIPVCLLIDKKEIYAERMI